MKSIVLFIVSVLFITSAFSQNITGTWSGIISTKQTNLTRNYYFNLEIKQDGRTVWGLFSTSDSSNNKSFTCLCSVSGSLNKKPAARLDLYKEHIEDFDKATASYLYCNFINRLNMHYFTEDNNEYLAGQWFPDSGGTFPGSATGGSFVLQRISNITTRPVDDYFPFPKLNKMIEKGRTDEKSPLMKADNISTATPAEKRMLNAIKSLSAIK